MKRISVKLPVGLAAWLERRSRELGRTRSELVRAALERDRNGDARRQNCGERLRRLNGLFDGPRDLSTNPRHLEGFGQ